MEKYKDTPIWNSKAHKRMWPKYIDFEELRNYKEYYLSPLEAKAFKDLPPTYIETAEFDCLHDEAIEYKDKLTEANVEVELNETKGTVHGFDINIKNNLAIKAIEKRVEFLQNIFYGKGEK